MYAEKYDPARYSYYIRLQSDEDEVELDYMDTPHEAALMLDELADTEEDGKVTHDGKRYDGWVMLKLDWYWHCDTVLDSGKF